MSIELRMAWRNVWRNPRRTWLTVAAIAFACLVLVFMLSFQLGSYASMIDSSVKIEAGHLQVQAEGYQDDREMRQVVRDPAAVERALSGIPEIEAFTRRASAFAVVSSEDRTYGALVIGVDPVHEPEVSSLESLVREGSFLDAAGGPTEGGGDGALVGELLPGGLGDARLDLGDGLRHAGEDMVANVLGERVGHATGNDAPGMDAFATEELDDLLAPLAQRDAVPGQLRILRGEGDDVALGRVGIEAEEQVW